MCQTPDGDPADRMHVNPDAPANDSIVPVLEIFPLAQISASEFTPLTVRLPLIVALPMQVKVGVVISPVVVRVP